MCDVTIQHQIILWTPCTGRTTSASETVLKANADAVSVSEGTISALEVVLQAKAEVVRTTMKSPQASVRQCAIRVFKVLGGDTLPESRQAPAAAAAAAPDLMGDLLGEEEAPAAAAPQDYLGELQIDKQDSCSSATDTGDDAGWSCCNTHN